MFKLIDLLTTVEFEIPMIAIVTVLLTGIVKQPIKCLANKTKNPIRITRFITLLPVILGFGLTVLFMFLYRGKVDFTDAFFNRWLSSVSLSLAIYAFWEKFIPSEKKILSDAEIKANRSAVEELKSKLINNSDSLEEAKTQITEHEEIKEATAHRKIILSNNKNLR